MEDELYYSDMNWCHNTIAALRARVLQLETKLEVDPQSNWDGIDCRDETIRLLENKLANIRPADRQRGN